MLEFGRRSTVTRIVTDVVLSWTPSSTAKVFELPRARSWRYLLNHRQALRPHSSQRAYSWPLGTKIRCPAAHFVQWPD